MEPSSRHRAVRFAALIAVLVLVAVPASAAKAPPLYLPLEQPSSHGDSGGLPLKLVHAPTTIVQLASSGKPFLDERTTVIGLRWHGWGKAEVTAGLQSLTHCVRATANAAWKCATYRTHGLGLAERIKTFTCVIGGSRRTVRLYTSVFFQAGGHGWALAPSGEPDSSFADDYDCTRG